MNELKQFSGIYLLAGQARHMTFEATSLAEAQQQAEKWGVGVEGETVESSPARAVQPEAFSLADSCRLLGGLSRATLYRWVDEGKLDRVPGVRKLLITRKSIQRVAA